MSRESKVSSITRLALLAVGNKEAAQLCMMIDRHLDGDFVIGVAASADIAILDGDAEGFGDALKQWQANRPGAAAVVLAAKAMDLPGRTVRVQKPLAASELFAALRQVGRQVAAVKVAEPLKEPPRPVASLPPVAAPAARPAPRSPDVSSNMLSVSICMSLDPGEIFETIGISSDISGNVCFPPRSSGHAAPLRAAL